MFAVTHIVHYKELLSNFARRLEASNSNQEGSKVESSDKALVDAQNRRQTFISDIVAVCAKHRVQISPEHLDCDAAEVCFDGHTMHEYDFSVSIVELESAVRQAVWPIIHGS